MKKYYAIKSDEKNIIKPSIAYHPQGYLDEYEAHELQQQLLCSDGQELVEFESRSCFYNFMEEIDSFNMFLSDINDIIENKNVDWL